jgi:hypothetical protein
VDPKPSTQNYAVPYKSGSAILYTTKGGLNLGNKKKDFLCH